MNSSVAFWPSAAMLRGARGLDDHPVLRGQRAGGLRLRRAGLDLARGTCGRRRPAARAAARSRRRGSRSRPRAPPRRGRCPSAPATSRSSIVSVTSSAHARTSSRRASGEWRVHLRSGARMPSSDDSPPNGQPPWSMCATNSSRNLRDVARDDDRGRVAERAEALAVDPVADVEQQVELAAASRARPRACAGSPSSSACPRGTACTCRTTRARRTRRSGCRAAPCSSGRRARRSRPSPSPCRSSRERVEVVADVDLVLRQDHRRRAARDHRLQLAAVGDRRRRGRR